MKPNWCPICESAHWSYDPHVWKEGVAAHPVARGLERAQKRVANSVTQVANSMANAPLSNVVSQPETEVVKLGPKRDRKEYMRELMRKRRAGKKPLGVPYG